MIKIIIIVVVVVVVVIVIVVIIIIIISIIIIFGNRSLVDLWLDINLHIIIIFRPSVDIFPRDLKIEKGNIMGMMMMIIIIIILQKVMCLFTAQVGYNQTNRRQNDLSISLIKHTRYKLNWSN